MQYFKLDNLLKTIILLTSWGIVSQSNPNDCTGAIKICGDGIIATNAIGSGNQEITGNSCTGQENNSIWLEVELVKSGTLGFDLIPDNRNIEIDYDFWIFGPDRSCGDIGAAIRCSTTNPRAAGQANNYTGMKDGLTDIAEGPGADGDSYVQSLNVEAGEVYYIVIDRFSGESSFTLQWTGTATVGGSPFPEGPIVNEPSDLQTCNANGIADFDIFTTASQITSQNNTSLSYHETRADASDNLNEIIGNYTSNQPVKTIYARVENDLTGCVKITDFDLIINDGPLIELEGKIEQCDLDFTGDEDYVLTDMNSEILNDLTPGYYEVGYYDDINSAKDNVNPIGSTYTSPGDEIVYARVWEKGNPDCYNISEISLVLNTPPQIESYSVVQPQVNANNNLVILDIPDSSNYEFSIGNINGPYQTSTTFHNVESGFQTLYIRDLKGCAIISSEIAIVGYDNFFTPNNDGINDFWQIKGISELTASDNLIHIFDRYGKLLKKLDASEKGWDGTFDGNLMPADDYWFKVMLQNGQEFNGHFSLVR